MKVLAKFYWNFGRSGKIDGLFIAEKSKIEAAYGEHVYLGEVLGKHSEVYGNLDEGDITIISEDPIIIEILSNLFEDGAISGFNPLDYIESDEDYEDNPEEA